MLIFFCIPFVNKENLDEISVANSKFLNPSYVSLNIPRNKLKIIKCTIHTVHACVRACLKKGIKINI